MALTLLGEKWKAGSKSAKKSDLCAALYTLYVHGATPTRAFHVMENSKRKRMHNVNRMVKGNPGPQTANVNLSIGKSCMAD